jgi:hypothetical protein
MTKKDYVKIAAAIKDGTWIDGAGAPIIRARSFIRSLMGIMAEDNPRFDRARFWKACGMPEAEL